MSTTCLSPFYKKDDISQENIPFPCGKCVPCLKRRVSGWSFRLMQEEARSASSFFVTFTYDTDHVPITPKGYMSLETTHFQLFMKKLRNSFAYRAINPETGRLKYYYDKVPQIKYFLAGEYGGKTFRPHYHAIIFGVPLSTLIGDYYSSMVARGLITLDGTRQFDCKYWQYGAITIGQVAEASVGYTLKYVMKEGKIPLHKNDDRLPEYQRVSKGMGANYLSQNMIDWHHDDLTGRYYTPLKGGKKIALPRYLKDKIYTPEQRVIIGKALKEKLNVDNSDLTGEEEIRRFESQSRRQASRLNETL